MNTFFNIITHIFIGTGVVGLIASIIYLIISTRYIIRMIIRSLSAIIGVFIYIGSKAVGLSIPSLILSSLEFRTPIPFGILAVLMPSMAGLLVAWLFIYQMNKANEFFHRIMIMLMSFITIMFGDVYFASYDIGNRGEVIDKSLLPNLCFIISMALYIVMKCDSIVTLKKDTE